MELCDRDCVALYAAQTMDRVGKIFLFFVPFNRNLKEITNAILRFTYNSENIFNTNEIIVAHMK